MLSIIVNITDMLVNFIENTTTADIINNPTYYIPTGIILSIILTLIKFLLQQLPFLGVKKKNANTELIEYLAFKIASKELPNEKRLQDIKKTIAYKYSTKPYKLYPLKKAIKLALIIHSKNTSIPINDRIEAERFFYNNLDFFLNILEAPLPLLRSLINHLQSIFKLYLIIFFPLFFFFIYVVSTKNSLDLRICCLIFVYSAISSMLGAFFAYIFSELSDSLDKKYMFHNKIQRYIKSHKLSALIIIIIVIAIYILYRNI